MRRVFEKLRGLYQSKVMKRFAWLRFFLVMLALGSVLAVVLHQALTAVDTRSAQRAMNESFEFVKAQLVRYNSYVSADKAKSLVRLMDKTAEAARILPYPDTELTLLGIDEGDTVCLLPDGTLHKL